MEGLYSHLLYIHESSLATGVITEEVLDIVRCLVKVIECVADELSDGSNCHYQAPVIMSNHQEDQSMIFLDSNLYIL